MAHADPTDFYIKKKRNYTEFSSDRLRWKSFSHDTERFTYTFVCLLVIFEFIFTIQETDLVDKERLNEKYDTNK